MKHILRDMSHVKWRFLLKCQAPSKSLLNLNEAQDSRKRLQSNFRDNNNNKWIDQDSILYPLSLQPQFSSSHTLLLSLVHSHSLFIVHVNWCVMFDAAVIAIVRGVSTDNWVTDCGDQSALKPNYLDPMQLPHCIDVVDALATFPLKIVFHSLYITLITIAFNYRRKRVSLWHACLSPNISHICYAIKKHPK